MNALSLFSSSMLIVVVMLGFIVVLRSGSLPATAHSPRLGWLAAGCYLLAVVAALLVWGRNADGLGIASILLGVPWSFMLMLVLTPLQMGLGIPDNTGWQLFLHVALLGPMLFNAAVLYHLGSRLPALWTSSSRMVK